MKNDTAEAPKKLSLRELEQKRASLLKERADLKKKFENQVEDAKDVFDLIFHQRFKDGGAWLDRTKRVGRRDKAIVNLLGGVRHLYAHLHTEQHIQAAMDRRGPNSAIQGPASNLGFVGGYFLRKLIWDFFESQEVTVGYRACNSIHDANIAEVWPISIPLVAYLSEHAGSTMLHRWMRDVMGFETTISFEMDCAVGPALSEMSDATRWDAQIAVIRKSLEWKRDNLGSKQPIDAIMKIVEHNADVIFRLRRREIKRQLENDERVSYHMDMNRDNALKLGLIFDRPAIKDQRNDSWRKEIK